MRQALTFIAHDALKKYLGEMKVTFGDEALAFELPMVSNSNREHFIAREL
jgi:hypothetical protein